MKIDKLSSRILAELNDYSKGVRTGFIADQLDSDRRKCLYRLSNPLSKQNLVVEVSDESEQTKRWKITRSGRELVDSKDFSKYKGFEHRMDEVENKVKEAVRRSESAKNSVQSYRGKVNYWMDKIEALEAEIGDIENIDDQFVRSQYLDSRLQSLKDNMDDALSDLSERIDGLEDDVNDLSVIVRENKETLQEVESEASERDERIEELEDRVQQLEKESEKGFWK